MPRIQELYQQYYLQHWQQGKNNSANFWILDAHRI